MSYTPGYNITNEQLLLIDILNGMYNDNLRQINTLNDSVNYLYSANRQIRSLLIQMLNNPSNQNRRNNNRNNQRTNNYRDNSSTHTNSTNSNNSNNSNNSSGLGRIYLNNRPYTIENFEYYTIPSGQNENERSNNRFNQLLQNFFQPIEIYPTQSQIETATRRVRYSDILTPVNRSCPISLENFNDSDMVTLIRFCGHIFNSEQLNTWFRSNCRCPVCRYDIRSYNANASSENIRRNETSENVSTTTSNAATDTENSSNTHAEERTTTPVSTNTNGRTNSLYLSTILDNFNNNDITLRDIENISSIFMDTSGNNTSDPLMLSRILTQFMRGSR
jgi:hypothetical protein